jgi:hypothetical protein
VSATASPKTTCPHCGKAGFKKQAHRDMHIRDAHKRHHTNGDDWLLNLFDAKVGGYGDQSWNERT